MDEFLLTSDTSVKLAENNGCSVYQFRNETGEGTITIYEVFRESAFPTMIFISVIMTASSNRIETSSASIIAGRGGWNTQQRMMPILMWKQGT